MQKTRILAAGLMGLMLLASAPKMTLADGAASTRNILLGVGAAAGTLIIINHNKKVHEKYAEDAQKQAALAEQRDDAQAAAQQYKLAYQHESVVAGELKKQVAIQQNEISKLQSAVASLNPPGSNFVAAKPASATATHSIAAMPAGQVVSYGWGSF
jgi:uncharacterized protein HemX